MEAWLLWRGASKETFAAATAMSVIAVKKPENHNSLRLSDKFTPPFD
ncbi:hypothetical protein NBRC116601_04040 [Cognatishimia sp. WU-CL00825]